MDTYIHTHVQTDTCMFMYRQTDRHTCIYIDGQTKSMYRQTNRLIETYIIMYIYNDRNIHARACRGIHACACTNRLAYRDIHVHVC